MISFNLFVLLMLLLLFALSVFSGLLERRAKQYKMETAATIFSIMKWLCMGLVCVIYLALLLRIEFRALKEVIFTLIGG